ncbi:MAG TPA: hypothetical protein VFN67_03565 [Polyangiales bacterium]|nr:hypothetical protein [Polyangiales bacterium]
MTEALETELDALFQLPAAEMVAARNALVSRLKKAGEREAAGRVSALKRPAPAAWAINQIFFQERELLERALAEVARVRELQATEGVDRQQLAAAVACHQAALQSVVDAALRNLAASRLPNAGPNERRVFATVQGWLGGGGDEAPGRMTRELEPTGFDGLGQLGIPAPLPAAGGEPTSAPPKAAGAAGSASVQASAGEGTKAAGSTSPQASASASPPPRAAGVSSSVGLSAGGKAASAPPGAAGVSSSVGLSAGGKAASAPPPRAAGGAGPLLPAAARRLASVPPVANETAPPAPDPEEVARRAREQAEARVFERKQSFEWAEGRLAEQRKRQSAAEQAVERAKHDVEDAERALALRRATLTDRQGELARRQEEREEAERAREAAERALQDARAELAKL